MMATQMLSEMEQEILAEARSVAERKISEAKKAAEDILRKARAEGEAEAAVLLRRNEENIRTLERKKLSDARRNAALQMLREKNALIDAVFEEARMKLKTAATGEPYTKALCALMETSISQLGGSELRVQLAEHDLKHEQAILKRVRIPPNVKLHVAEKPLNCSGGFVLATVDDRVRVDNTFEARLSFIERGLRKEVAKILFGS